MNRMTQRRAVLLDKLKSIIDAKSEGFKYADRLRRETFDSITRQQRIKVMGDPTKYAEVLFSGYASEQEDAGGNVVLDNSIFRVNVWHFYYDADNYNDSSQKAFDDLCFADDGILPVLDSDNMLDEGLWILDISAVEQLVVSLDNEGTELAHFLTFTITMR